MNADLVASVTLKSSANILIDKESETLAVCVTCEFVAIQSSLLDFSIIYFRKIGRPFSWVTEQLRFMLNIFLHVISMFNSLFFSKYH